jgi:AcrR family transcriptional regulator
MARTGRRRGSPDTREAIVHAAAAAFAEKGFDGASIRAIAAIAGVDPALVHHYFGTKEQLFLATVNAPLNPADLVPRVVAGDIEGVGERLVRTLLAAWDNPAVSRAGAALLRTAVQHDWSRRMLREFLTTQVLRRVMRELRIDPAEGPTRAALVASQVMGLIMIRYIMGFEPLASAEPEAVVAAVAPTIQRYVTGPLPRLDTPAPATGAVPPVTATRAAEPATRPS